MLAFFGQISYELYLYHLLCFRLYYRWLTPGVTQWTSAGLYTRFVVAGGAAVLLATISRRTVEGSLLRFKDRPLSVCVNRARGSLDSADQSAAA